ncbi:hypothetical protein TCAL_04960, partial [Tigriopus californicus]
QDFVHSNVVTTVDTMTAPLSEVFFPSVVVCNINQVRDSYFEELLANQKAMVQQSQAHNENLTLVEDVDVSGTHQLCKDMFIYSKWNGSTTFSFESERDFGTDYGICCWYTPQFNFTEIVRVSHEQGLEEPNWGHWFTNIEKGAKTGKDNGYTMLLDIESFDYKFFNEGSEGLKVALVHHLDMPIMRQIGFHISPGTENQIAVTPTLISTSKHAVERFVPEQRDCYCEDEISLKYLPRDHGYRYEMSNCLFEAAFENILEQCNCFPGFHTTGDESHSANYSTCIGDDLVCVNELMNRMGQFDHVVYQGKQVKCRSNCEDQINSVFVTSSTYPNKHVFVKRPEFCYTLIRLFKKCNSSKRYPVMRAYPGLCFILEEVDFLESRCQDQNVRWKDIREFIPNCNDTFCPLEEIDPYAKKFLKDVKTTKTSYIANSGGILGLCMGFSFISGAEVIFHFLSSIFPSLSAGKGGVPARKVSLDQNGPGIPGDENPAHPLVRKCPKHGCKLTRKKCHILRGRAGFPSCFKRGNPSHRVTKYPIYGPERFI